MRTKKILILLVFVSVLFILTRSINATEIINNDIQKNKDGQISKRISELNIRKYKIENILSNSDNIKNLHEFFMLVWNIISILIGHNIISLTIARVCCCWFIFPMVVLNDLTNINISGDGFLKYFQECLSYFNIEEIIYSLGALSVIILPFIYVFSLCLAILCVIKKGFNIEGGFLAKLQEDLNYIYSPDMLLSNYSIDNNVSGFKQYMKGFDNKLYFYNTGLIGLVFSIPFIVYCKIYFNKFYSENNIKKSDGIPEKPFLNFLLRLVKMVMDFILSILNKQPII